MPAHDPPAVFGSDAVAALDKAGIDRGVVFSSGYLYGLASLNLEPEAVARLTRRENNFTAAEVAKFPDRLTGFLSADPMQPSAIDRFLFGSDYNVLAPAEAVWFNERLGLTPEELNLLRQNCAPWVCLLSP